MARTTVGVLRGGSSSEYDYSLKSGAAVLNALPEDKYDTRDIFIDKTGLWHLRGIPSEPVRALSQVDVALNMLHGGAGEDGTVQRILQRFSVPYAGSTALAAALSHNKARARYTLEKAGIPIPRGLAFNMESNMNTGEMARMVFSQFAPPYIVKPVSEGSSHGIRMASTILELPNVLGDVLDEYGAAVVEEFVVGEEVLIPVLENYRNEDLYVFPPVHVVLPEGERWLTPGTYAQGLAKHVAPSPFSHEEKRAMAELARAAHKALGASHFSMVGAIVKPRHAYVLEVDSVPHLHPTAPLHAAFDAVGTSLTEFLEHIISLARR